MATHGKKTTDLRVALETFRPAAPHLGEEEASIQRPDDSLGTFRNNLLAVSAANRSYFLVCVAFLVVIFAGGCYLIIHFRDTPQSAAAVFGAVGISFGGLTAQMTNLWKKKVTSDMLLVLAGQLRPMDMKSITDVLLREYLK